MNLRVVPQSNLAFEEKLAARTLNVGVIGLGYVGLPLVEVFWRAGFATTGFEIDPVKIEKLAANTSYIRHFPAETVRIMNESGRFWATDDLTRLADMDAILICVPTPLTATREPDLQY